MDKKINDRIRYYRRCANITQEQAGDALGMKRSAYSRMEAQGTPSPERIKALAELFKIPVTALLYDKSETTSTNTQRRNCYAFDSSSNENIDDDEPVFVPTVQEIQLMKMMRIMSKKDRDAVIQFISDRYLTNRTFED